MADLYKQFLVFHDTIKLGTYEENSILREKRDLLIDELKVRLKDKKDDNYPQFVKKFDQGSYALGTGIKPIKDGDYDIDVGVLLDCYKEAYNDPVEVKEMVKECLTHENRSVAVSRSCVTVTYVKDGADEYHVDLPIYARSEFYPNDEKYFLAKGRKSLTSDQKYWQESDPIGLTTLINDLYKENNNYDNGGEQQRKQFRRIVRYLKRWRRHKNVDVHSITLTIMAYHWLVPNIDGNDDHQTTLNLINNILNQFISGRLIVSLPITPYGDLLESTDNEDMKRIKNAFETLRDNLQNALYDPDLHEASKTLRKSFGEDFPLVPKEEQSKKVESAPYVSTGSSA